MIKSPSALVRAALVAKFADVNLGVNPVYASVVPNYAGAGSIAINFQLPGSLNFFLGRVPLDEIIAAGNFTFPLMVMYTTAGKDTHKNKGVLYDGPVTAVVGLYLSSQAYAASAMQSNFEVWMDAAEDALLQVCNNLSNQNWGPYVTYNGDFGFERGDVQKAGSNWLQALFVSLRFEVTVP